MINFKKLKAMRLLMCFFLLTVMNTQLGAQNCAGWGDGIDSIKVHRYYEVYRNQLVKNDFDRIEFFWSLVFEKAPGATKNVYLDGVKIYKHLYRNENNPSVKKKHLNKIVEIFDRRANCYPQDKPNILSRKALELKKLDADLEMLYQAFTIALKEGGDEIPSFALVPCAEVVTQYYLEGGISGTEKDKIYHQIERVSSINILNQNDKSNYYAAWVVTKKTFKEAGIISSNNYDKLANTSTDCYAITRDYKAKVSKEPENENLMIKALNELGALDCEAASKYRITLLDMQEARIRKKIDGSLASIKSGSIIEAANYAYQNGNFIKSIELYNTAIEEAGDESKKATLIYQTAKIYYVKLSDKFMAKNKLLEVLKLDPNHGKSYLLLGDIYYAAAKECFPTDQFDQKMVIYASMDKWKQAKKVDASLQGVADDRIDKYSPYLPSKSELFLARSRFKGNNYRISCWIREKVKVKF